MFSWVECVGLSVVEKLAVQSNIDLSSPLVTFLDRFGEYVARESRALQLQQRCIRTLYNELEQLHTRVTREVTALRGTIVSSSLTKMTPSTGAMTTAAAPITNVNDMQLKVDRHPQTYLPVVRVSLNYVPDLVVYVPRRYAAILKSAGNMYFNNNHSSCDTTTTENGSERKSGGEGITFGLHVRREHFDTTSTITTTTKCDRKKQSTECVSQTQTQGQAEKCVTPQKQKKKQEQQTNGNGSLWPSPPRRTYRQSPRLSGELAKAAENLRSKCKAAAWRVSVTDLVKCWVDAVATIPPAELQRLQTWNCDDGHNSITNNANRNIKLDGNGKINGQCEEAGTNVNTEKNRGVKRSASEMSPSHQTPRQKGRWKARRVSVSSSPSPVTSPTGAVGSNGSIHHQHDPNGNNNTNRNNNDNQNNSDNNNNNNNNNSINSNSNSNNNSNNNHDKKTSTHSEQGANINGNIKPASSSADQKNVADSPQQKKQNGFVSSAGVNSSPTPAANVDIYGPTAAKPPTGRAKHRWGMKTKAHKQQQQQQQQQQSQQQQELKSGIMVGCNTAGNTAIRSTGSFKT